MKTEQIAKTLIFCNDTVLVMTRSASHPTHPGKWDLPGGMVEPGEDYAVAVAREVFEESGINLEPTAFTAVFGYSEVTGETNIVRIGFVARLDGQPPAVILSEEHGDHKWAALHEAVELLGTSRWRTMAEYVRDNRLMP